MDLGRIIEFIITCMVLVLVIFAQIYGNYNRVYYYVQQDGVIITVGKTTQTEWQNAYNRLKNNPYLVDNINETLILKVPK